MEISGSTVLLTGATGGIGHAIARALHARGAHLILTGRRADVLEPLAAELGGRALEADLGDRVALERLIDDAGRVDILLANAALPGTGRLESWSIDEIDRSLEVNLRAPIVLARALLPAMLERSSGHLLFMSSLSGKASSPLSALYNTSKYGLRGFASALRTDLRGSGVGVSAVFPGFIRDAGMFADAVANAGVKLPPGVGTRSPEDVARACITAIERNRGEIDVAPLALRIGTIFAGIAPELAGNLSRRMGAEGLAVQFADAQEGRR
jgi:short-subunit dehydrogenase